MRKLLGRYIFIIMIVVDLLCIVFFWCFGFERKKNLEKETLISVVNQVENILEINEERDKGANWLFEEDYLNRARSIAYIIDSADKEDFTSEQLQEYAKKMEVEKIHVLSGRGVVVNSSDPSSIGMDFNATERMRKFTAIISSPDPDAYYIQGDGYNVLNPQDAIYIGVRFLGDLEGMLQIEVSPERLKNYIREFSIATVMRGMPTQKVITMFVIDEETGVLKGITQHDYNNIDTEYTKGNLNELKSYINRTGTIMINGIENLIYAERFHGNLVFAVSNLDDIKRSVFIQVLVFAILAIFTIAVVVGSLYRLIEYFIIQDVEKIVDDVDCFLQGKLDIKFQAKNKTELYNLVEGLNKWVKSYDSRGERYSGIMVAMGNKFAMYEYNYELNHLFFSDNLPNMLELSRLECDRLIRDTYRRNDQLVEKMQRGEEHSVFDVFITESGRQIQIERMRTDQVYYAVIRDISEENKKIEKLSEEILKIKNRAERDALTGIYNREKITKTINHFFEQNLHSGILLLLDIDNFKRVNDELGHPEGDQLLKRFAEILVGQFRESDMKARLGGDEFVVFISNTMEQKKLEEKLEDLLNVYRRSLNKEYKKQQLSVSIGAAYIDPSMQCYEDLYKAADSAMYVAKRIGKDQYYINEQHVNCMRKTCIHCRKTCMRRETLFAEAE